MRRLLVSLLSFATLSFFQIIREEINGRLKAQPIPNSSLMESIKPRQPTPTTSSASHDISTQKQSTPVSQPSYESASSSSAKRKTRKQAVKKDESRETAISGSSTVTTRSRTKA